MPILNYRTRVAPEATFAELQRLLVRRGACSVTALYDGGALSGLVFRLPTAFGEREYRLAVNVAGVREVLLNDLRSRPGATLAHARRVAWRILKDWLVSLFAVVDSGGAELEQALLPWMVVDARARTTVWDVAWAQELAARGVLALPAPRRVGDDVLSP